MLSIQDLIKKSTEKKSKIKKDIRVFECAELGGKIKVEIPSPYALDEMLIGENDLEKATSLIYLCTIEPKLNDESLIQTLGCKAEPGKVVAKIMSPETIYNLGMYITDLSNSKVKDYRVELADTIKN